jgi:two-component system phosphate regulon response regulator PhoB
MHKVIVIDDEPFILMMIEDKLKRAGIQVITLRESKNALAVIRREIPDLIILDWMMPEVSGIDICKSIEAAPELKDIPVFLLTAKGQDADKHLGIKCGAAQYITKPFSPRALMDMVVKTITDRQTG